MVKGNKKQDQTMCCLWDPVQLQGHTQSESKGMEIYFMRTDTKSIAEIVILIPETIDLRQRLW